MFNKIAVVEVKEAELVRYRCVYVIARLILRCH